MVNELLLRSILNFVRSTGSGLRELIAAVAALKFQKFQNMTWMNIALRRSSIPNRENTLKDNSRLQVKRNYDEWNNILTKEKDMNDRDLLQGFRRCKDEILTLRKQNELMRVQLDMADRILNAVNSHKPQDRSVGMSEDIVWQIRKTEEFLEKEIAAQDAKNNAPVPRVEV
jgi:hypothetical protein